jgi:hypothetical protein
MPKAVIVHTDYQNAEEEQDETSVKRHYNSLVVLVFRYQEIGTKMALTEFPTPGTRKV